MTTRRNFFAGAALLAAGLPLGRALAEAPKGEQPGPMYLFVQNAKSMTFDKSTGTLTLKEISPMTVYFSDRPDRITGNMPTTSFMPLWKDGKDSFDKDPPNATLSIFTAGKVSDTVVELRDPVLKGETLSYKVKILEGELPANGGAAALFIDVIGMPLTPVSYAGAARRRVRW
jgi:hypothetical protein